ncbi:hypothetical protein [Desulfoscipio geothermicus]|uniref:Uncharacterized protein n=1 Tax=Desulfoscipio geothermicus DSM 3669 TaxID=1121426 RepID=A0A1I6DFY1_9FIRM|nr:hypothetical protein [Desulfoscipio geothermicus]SFR04355.1 hypothetical protein SAMN05660706_11050 [Desulfoscipio geothermicus DSM 3669]
MDGDKCKMEQILLKLMDYKSQQGVDQDGILIMLSLLNLMGMVEALNRDGAADAAGEGTGGMEALLGSLMALMAAGSMGGSRAGSGGQAPFNPAALLSLLGSLGGKGGSPDLSGLLGLLGPLMGASGPSLAGQQVPNNRNGHAAGQKSRPVQREINLDAKSKPANGKNETAVQRPPQKASEQPPKPGEVLKWDFGT